jgi:pimeloyl-ACP methyl ester carboxylesterase
MTGFIELGGHRLETRWIAPTRSGRPTLVLLHEGLGSVALWRDFPDRLARRTGCGLLVYSRYGHGASTPLEAKRPIDYLQHEAEVVLPAVLRHFGIARPILFGHSDGASIALIHAGFRPGDVAGLVLEAPHVFVEDVTIAGILRAREAYRTTDLAAKLRRHHQDADRTFRGWNDVWLDPRFRTWNIEGSLPAIRCPILAIQGADDEYGTVAQLDAIAARTPATEILLLEHCGHSPHRERPDETLDHAAGFVDKMGSNE